MLNRRYILGEKYEVIKVLGKGNMGTVYLCKDSELKKLWSIKEVNEEFKTNIDFKVNMDFLLELNEVKKLSHRGISRIVDVLYEDDNLYIVQEYIEGKTLKEYVKERESIGTKNIVPIISSICDIIGYLQNLALPMKYRYLKPSNIIITPNGKAVLTDFGISKMDKAIEEKDNIYMGTNGCTLAVPYGLRQANKQTDIYNIGRVMYFMTTGKIPNMDLEPLIDDNYGNNVDSSLKRIIQKCFEIDIKNRYASIEELNKEIIIELFKGKKGRNIVNEKKADIEPNISTEKIKTKKSNKSVLKRRIIGMVSLMITIFVTVYILNC
ncbi:serine/threonine-protein kinase [Clostridium sp. ZS2-4]|uniref:serine/threonine-protein kinase n=1 Tax=Clostridium sp. ZS2-4 TaxID=2987703 RepID=UPI00227A2166|nr:serine/threonine-protein kinase [Clostridium sp. ZS2-4]MCY6355171.1 serine/threonine-protein kinase [Clostridium sp. ZS2-4]